MKTLGLIGGMSPESTVSYYQIINREVNQRCLGGNHSADMLMHSVNFETIAALQRAGDWQQAGAVLAASAKQLESMAHKPLCWRPTPCTKSPRRLSRPSVCR